jgi:hypothetical protein
MAGMQCIRRSTRTDAAAISALRLSAYQAAREFTVVKPDALAWSDLDDVAVVLAAWDESDRAVSTMQGRVFDTRSEAEADLECDIPLDAAEFPALGLGKGATRPERHAAGVHSLIRYHFLSAVDPSIKAVLGVVFAGAPRLRLMETLGYEFRTPARYWYTDLRPERPTLVACLPAARIAAARAALFETVRPVLADYPWHGPPLRISAAGEVSRASGWPR